MVKRKRLIGPTDPTDVLVDRLRATAPVGPAFGVLVLDTETIEALVLGAINSRAEVEASRVLARIRTCGA